MKRHERPIEIRDKRLRGGRLKISAKASSLPEWRRRDSAVRALMDAGEYGILERLRSGLVHISDVQRAHEAGDLMPLRAGLSVFRLGEQCEALMGRVTDGTTRTYQAIGKALRAYFGDARDMSSVTTDEAVAFLMAARVEQRDGSLAPWMPGRRKLMAMAAGRLWDDCIRAASEAARVHGDRPSITLNPWKAAGKGRAVKDAIRPRVGYLQPHQWAALYEQVKGTRRAAFYALGCLAGLRLQEVLHLRTGLDVDFAGRGRVRVQPRGGEYAWKPKTPRSVRDVAMTPTLRRILEEHAEVHAGKRYFLIHEEQDRPIPDSSVAWWVRGDFPAAGLVHGRKGEGLTFHSLRHTFASWAVQEGESILKVARVMGDTAAMIETVYGHLAPTDLETVSDAVERKVLGAVSTIQSTRKPRKSGEMAQTGD